jgi:hypothetical protein
LIDLRADEKPVEGVMMFSILRNTALGAAALGLYGSFALPAQAAFIADMAQVGANVVITGNGSFDIIGLTSATPIAGTAGINPSFNDVVLGSGNTGNSLAFTGLTPSSGLFNALN